jgi:hypothetical protein
MWARIAEVLAGVWLMMTPVVFAGTESVEAFVARDIGAGLAIVALSLLSFWRRTPWAHLVTALVALGLGLTAYFGWERPGPAAAQNEIAVALTLILFAIVPNEATQPPRPWRDRTATHGRS